MGPVFAFDETRVKLTFIVSPIYKPIIFSVAIAIIVPAIPQTMIKPQIIFSIFIDRLRFLIFIVSPMLFIC